MCALIGPSANGWKCTQIDYLVLLRRGHWEVQKLETHIPICICPPIYWKYPDGICWAVYLSILTSCKQNLLKTNQPLAAGRTTLTALLCNSFYSLTRTNSLFLQHGNSSFVSIHRALGLFVLGLKMHKACYLLCSCSIFTHHVKTKELQITSVNS